MQVQRPCLAVGWARQAEERRDGRQEEGGWLGGVLLCLAQPQPCHPPLSPANVTLQLLPHLQ